MDIDITCDTDNHDSDTYSESSEEYLEYEELLLEDEAHTSVSGVHENEQISPSIENDFYNEDPIDNSDEEFSEEDNNDDDTDDVSIIVSLLFEKYILRHVDSLIL